MPAQTRNFKAGIAGLLAHQDLAGVKARAAAPVDGTELVICFTVAFFILEGTWL